MKDLIERLEKATEADRELDCLIWAATNNHAVNYLENGMVIATPRDASAESFRLGFIDPGATSRNFYTAGFPSSATPTFTSSIDAALTLVSEDIDVEFCRDLVRPAGKLWFAYLSAGDPRQAGFKPQDGRADTAAVALCIAALKVRATLTAAQQAIP